MIDRDQAIAAIRASQFSHAADRLIELLEPSIRIGVKQTPREELPLGASRIGGPADLPECLTWPVCRSRPLAHLAQFQLSELGHYDAAHLLPDDGWLYFFFDTGSDSPYERADDGDRAWRVLHYDGHLGDLRRVDPPAGHDPRNVFAPFAVGFDAELSLPCFDSSLMAQTPLEEDQRTEYEDLVFSLHHRPPIPGSGESHGLGGWFARMQHRRIGDPIHRILGHPEHFQRDPRIDWQNLSVGQPVAAAADEATWQAAQGWRLLLQLDAFRGGPQWMWGDNGTVYFGIARDDLANKNFNAAQWTVECG